MCDSCVNKAHERAGRRLAVHQVLTANQMETATNSQVINWIVARNVVPTTEVPQWLRAHKSNRDADLCDALRELLAKRSLSPAKDGALHNLADERCVQLRGVCYGPAGPAGGAAHCRFCYTNPIQATHTYCLSHRLTVSDTHILSVTQTRCL